MSQFDQLRAELRRIEAEENAAAANRGGGTQRRASRVPPAVTLKKAAGDIATLRKSMDTLVAKSRNAGARASISERRARLADISMRATAAAAVGNMSSHEASLFDIKFAKALESVDAAERGAGR